MVFQKVNEMSFDEAKLLSKAIINVIKEFLDSIEKNFPNMGFGEMAQLLASIQSDIDLSSGPFLSADKINEVTSVLFDTFSTMNDDLETNLQKLFSAYKEISNFISKNNADIEFRLLDFNHSRIDDIKTNNTHLFDALKKIRDSNYEDETILRGLFSIFSSIVETSEQLHRDELIDFRNKINQYAKSNQLQYEFPYDPVDVFSIGTPVVQNNGRKYTKQRALRHLIDHHHFKIDSEKKQIHFKSPDDDPTWKFDFDEIMSFQEFCNYVGIVDAFYKSTVWLKFRFQLVGTLREHFQKNLSLKTKLQMQYLLNHLNQHPYFSK